MSFHPPSFLGYVKVLRERRAKEFLLLRHSHVIRLNAATATLLLFLLLCTHTHTRLLKVYILSVSILLLYFTHTNFPMHSILSLTSSCSIPRHTCTQFRRRSISSPMNLLKNWAHRPNKNRLSATGLWVFQRPVSVCLSIFRNLCLPIFSNSFRHTTDGKGDASLSQANFDETT